MRSKNEVVCPKCKRSVALRTNRASFLQRRVLNLLGIYPWKCGACGSDFLSPQRNACHGSSLLEPERAESTGKS